MSTSKFDEYKKMQSDISKINPNRGGSPKQSKGFYAEVINATENNLDRIKNDIKARVIVIDSEISGYKYCETFVHEALHLKKFSGNETYISFETFRYMYETKELKNVAVCYGLEQIYGEFYEEYNVAHLIVDYLTKK